jgi:hypothetical protein
VQSQPVHFAGRSPAVQQLRQQQFGEGYEDDDPLEDKDLSYQEAANNLTEMLGRSAQPSYQATKLYVPRRTEVKSVAAYGPPVSISPLRDERNEQTFCHFVEITSNTMSIFERHVSHIPVLNCIG